MKNIVNWTQIYKKYKGKWVTLDKDEQTVISSASKGTTAFKKAQDKGFEAPILMHIPKEVMPYIGYSLA
ncbi:hypothetical protein CL633_02505 [bacterium]|nr:hypothetical protein [bacterium]|tara:strand:+ start:1863 stop:2069 length:207 start_codon:yes stop_codon:yes gene_type:complete